MTYQELVKCYPWIDLVLELFKGVMPTFTIRLLYENIKLAS